MKSDWIALNKRSEEKIMGTDIFCEIHCPKEQQSKAESLLEEIFRDFQTFADRFSRFRSDNELYTFNHSGQGTLSLELYEMLLAARFFYQHTQAIFDPSILPLLEEEGYKGAYPEASDEHSFQELIFLTQEMQFTKPRNLMLDLGGLGKGYIVDQVTTKVREYFDHFLIDAGGDIYLSGTNKVDHYPYWAIDVENPHAPDTSLALLTLSNMAVATSGINRRHWQKGHLQKHHLIDTRTKTSATSDLISVTVIAPSTLCADILAKTLYILGQDAGQKFATQYHIPALFTTLNQETIINPFAQPYVWQT